MIKKNKEIIFLTQYFYPDIASTGLLMTDLCTGFVNQGFNVKVFTAKPNYDNTIEAETDEKYMGVFIKRLFCLRLNKNNKIFNILNSLSYFISVLLYVIFKNEKGTFMMVSNPPFLSIVGLFIKYFKGNDFVYVIHDLFPEAGIRLKMFGKNSFIAKIWDFINDLVFRQSKNVVVLSESMKEVLLDKIKIFDLDNIDEYYNKVKVIDNWANEKNCSMVSKETNSFVEKYNTANKFVLMYSGNVSEYYNIEILIEIARIIRDDDFLFFIIGDGSNKKYLMNLKEKYSLKNIYFLPFFENTYIKYSLSAADILVLFSKEDFAGVAVPSKLYTYMSMGKTIMLFTNNICDSSKIIRDANCGFSFNTGELNIVVEKIKVLKRNKELLQEFEDNARKYYLKNYSFEIALNKYMEIFTN